MLTLVPQFIHSIAEFTRHLFTLDASDPFKTGSKLVAMIVGAVTVGTTFATKTYPWLRAKIDSRSVSKGVGAKLFTAASIERSLRYYIPPFCQSIDPAGGEESRLIHSVKSQLFGTLDEVLSPSSEERYHILLADSGMGKTSALLNYYARHIRRWRKPFKIVIIPLGIPDADERIVNVDDKEGTVLFLDALDEDTLAMVDHVERLRLLMDATKDFMQVLITCRTQFFSKDEEIPKETGVIKLGARRAGEPAEYMFYKIYLTPFTDQQVVTYLKRRYPIWQRKRRQQAFKMEKKIPHLAARPMLLAHIDDLVRAKREISYSFELYEEMVDAWIHREKGFIKGTDDLHKFSERLAVDLFVNRSPRGAEVVSKQELTALAKKWGIRIADYHLSGRSLLNRDAEGNFKFAHRSIMEALFVSRFLKGEPQCLDVEWTDQMKTFLFEAYEGKVGPHLQNQYQSPIKNLFVSPQAVGLLIEVLTHVLATQPVDWQYSSSASVRTVVMLCGNLLDLVKGRINKIEYLVGRYSRTVTSQKGDTLIEFYPRTILTYREGGFDGYSHGGSPYIFPTRPVVSDGRAFLRAGLVESLDSIHGDSFQQSETEDVSSSQLIVPFQVSNEPKELAVLMAYSAEPMRPTTIGPLRRDAFNIEDVDLFDQIFLPCESPLRFASVKEEVDQKIIASYKTD